MAFERLSEWFPYDMPSRYTHENLEGSDQCNRFMLLFMNNHKYKKGQKIFIYLDPRIFEEW